MTAVDLAPQPARVSWPILAVIGFVLLQSLALSAAWALPWLVIALTIAAWRGELRMDAPTQPLEWALIGWLGLWLLSAWAGIDMLRSLALSVPLLAFALMLLALLRAPGWPADPWALLAGLAAAGAVQSAQWLWAAFALQHPSPAAIADAAHLPWLVVPNDMLWMACLWPWLWRVVENAPTRVVRIGFALALGLQLAAAVSAESRLVWLTAAVAVVIDRSPRWPRQVIGLAVAALAIAALDALNGGVLIGKGLASLGARAQLWLAALRVFLEHPWLGVGPHNFVLAYASQLPLDARIDPRLTPWPHSLPLEILAELGVLGVLFCFTMLQCAAHAARAMPDTLFRLRGVLAGLALAAVLEASTLRTWLWVLAAVSMGWVGLGFWGRREPRK